MYVSCMYVCIYVCPLELYLQKCLIHYTYILYSKCHDTDKHSIHLYYKSTEPGRGRAAFNGPCD